MIKASVFIICKNEQKHIKTVLESVKDFDEIIIVDSGSSDDTLDIAKQYTHKIFIQEWLGFSAQKDFARNLCTNKWVLNLDADEQLSKELKQEIKECIKKDNIDGLEIKLSSEYMGKFNHKFSKFNTRIRFFKKNLGHYPPKLVHESIILRGVTKKAKGYIYEYGSTNLNEQIAKINNYSSLRAKEKFEKNKKPSCIKLIFIFPLAFLKSFIIKRNFLNGKRGFIQSIVNSFYAFLKEAKLFEKNLT